MTESVEKAITDAVIGRFHEAPNPRIREISESLVRNLHNFIREIKPTQDEWGYAIDFLTRTGQKCSDTRQEFILMSDTLGVSMLVDAINNVCEHGETESTVLGPFYVQNPQVFANGADIAGKMKGTPLYIAGRILSADGKPIANATVDIWHSDEAGFYDVQQMEELGGFAGRARLVTDAEGKFSCWTVEPIEYPVPSDGPVGAMLLAQGRHPWRPAHVHFMIEAAGYRKLVTHIFVEGNKYLESDAVFGVKESLVREFPRHPQGVAPDGSTRKSIYSTLDFDFKLAKG